MSEPKSKARRTYEIAPGLHRWKVSDDRIGGMESDAYAFVSVGRVTLIDPLPIGEEALRRLGLVEAIVLTAANHQRSAWRYRRALGVPVHAPEGVPVGPAPGELEEAPDQTYREGTALPGGLEPLHAPGPAMAMYALWLQSTQAVFVSDLLVRQGPTPTFVPAEYQDDPHRTRTSVRRLLEGLPIEIICFAHGPPLVRGARRALMRALEQDREPMPETPVHLS